MVRPCKKRNIKREVKFTCFKPAGVSRDKLKKVELLASELEALRLFNLKGLSQEDSSKMMNISASTFNRLLKKANKKIVDALVNGKGIRIYKINGTHNCE